jgi:hypothetical protein
MSYTRMHIGGRRVGVPRGWLGPVRWNIGAPRGPGGDVPRTTRRKRLLFNNLEGHTPVPYYSDDQWAMTLARSWY